MGANYGNQKYLQLGKIILPEVVGLVIFLLLWQWGAMQYDTLVLPSPLETLSAIERIARRGILTSAILTTAFHLLTAFWITVFLGVLLGIISGIQSWFQKSISPVISVLQGVPPIAWIVLALLWFGSGSGTPIFTIVVATLPIIFFSAVEGIRSVPTPLLEMAHLFRIPPTLLFREIYFPHLLSYLFPSLAAGLGLAWRVAVMAELLSSETGIGAELNLARINLDTDEVMAWIAIVVMLIWLCEYLILRPLRRWLEPWRINPKVKEIEPQRLSVL